MTISAAVYDSDGVTEHQDIAHAKTATGTTWIRAREATDAEVDRIASTYDLHLLAIEDVENDVRPKLEEFESYTFFLIKTAELSRGETSFDKEITTKPIGVFIGADWVISICLGDDGPVERVWKSVINEDERLLQRGPDFTAYRIIDVIVDEYFILLDQIETDIEEVEEAVLSETGIETVEALNAVRRDLLSFRKLTWPTREAMSVLARGDVKYIQESTEKYFRDVYDHLVQVVDLSETYRDLVSGARDIYLNTVSQSTNEVMKVLTVVATIFLPLTFVVGIYGMNFEGGAYNMPELSWQFGYLSVMIGLGLVSGILLIYFRREGIL